MKPILYLLVVKFFKPNKWVIKPQSISINNVLTFFYGSQKNEGGKRLLDFINLATH